MATSERYPVDVFAIIVLIFIVLIIIYLVVVTIYFNKIWNLNPPTQSEATFLFWTTVVLAILFFSIGVYTLVRIFTYNPPANERYRVDIFAIIILIFIILIMVYLIVVAVYFYNLMNLRPPTQNESRFLFWTSIVLSIIFAFLGIYALIRILTHKSIVYELEELPMYTIAPQPTYVQPVYVQPETIEPPHIYVQPLPTQPPTHIEIQPMHPEITVQPVPQPFVNIPVQQAVPVPVPVPVPAPAPAPTQQISLISDLG